ncbi:uncharacterized protein [Acropora muricata]|uniref:uncharacterized protein n=1 Tax=Acropora muricata TaxID=159855 RepID=UPI0034E53827
MSPRGKGIWAISRSDFCWLCNALRVLLLSLAFFVSVTRPYNSNNSVSAEWYQSQKEHRWSIEKVHLVKALRSRERDFKSGIIPLRRSKNAFVIGKNNFKKKRHLDHSKESGQRDALNNIISLFKEKEDSMILSKGTFEAIHTHQPIPHLPVQTIPKQSVPAIRISPSEITSSNNSAAMSNHQILGKHVPQDSQVLSNEISKVQKDSKFYPNGSSSPETRELNKMKASPAKSKTIADDVANKDARNFPVKFQPSLEAPMKSTGGRNSLSGIHTAKHYYEKISSAFHSTTPSPSYTSSSTFNRKSSFPTSKEPASVSTPLGTPTKSSSDNKSAITSNGYQNPIPRNIPVLCQVICGNGCCSPKLKTSLTQTSAQTTRTTEPTTKTKGELTSKPTEPPDVIATPPLPLWHLENNPQGFPNEEHPSLVPSLPAGPMPRPAMGPLSTFATPRMDRTLTPATLSPNEQTKETLPFGPCQDYHPDCPAFVISRMCEQETQFRDEFDVREVCMLSCGMCNSLRKKGSNFSSKKQTTEERPEDMGFPEYSKKFLRR